MSEQRGKHRSERHSGIELLRMLAGMGVIILHFNFVPSGGGALESATGVNAAILMFLENLCICAVNVFILVTGYFGSTAEKTKPGKLILLLLQTIVFQVLVQLGSAILNHNFSTIRLPDVLLPVNYYVILYVALMLLAPFINKLLKQLSDKALTRLTVLSFAVFSIWSSGADVLQEITGNSYNGLNPVGLTGSLSGYSIVNFILVYLAGAWIRRNTEKLRKVPTGVLAALLLAAVALLWGWRKVLPATSWMYCNPLVIAEGVLLLLLFERMTFRSKIVNLMAPASFTCFLIHEALLSRLDSTAIGQMQPLLFIVVLPAVVTGIYLVSFAVMLIWNGIIRLIFRDRLDRIPAISAQ